MVSIIEGFNNNVIKNFESFGATLVQFQKFDPQFGPGGNRDEDQRTRKNLTYDDALALKELCPSMLAVSPERYWWSGGDGGAPDVVYEGRVGTPDTVVGVTEDYPIANNHFIGEGRFISDISMPERDWRACLSDMTPFDVDTIAIPNPLRTRGISVTPT